MATAMDENYNGINDSTSNQPTTATTTTTTTTDDVPDYNEAFPQLRSAGKTDDDRRRKLTQHASSVITKIIEIPPEERVPEKPDGGFRRGPPGASRNPPGANSSGQTIQKICQRIQKETSTNITFMYKNQTLLVTITGRPEQVRLAQVQLLREIQRPLQKSVNVPWDFHRYIIGTKGATLKLLEQETGTTIKVPSQESQTSGILVEGAKDNVNLCEQKILQLYHTQMNKGFERLSIPYLYHPWIRNHLLDDLQRQYGVTISLPPVLKQADEISIRGEREPVEQAKSKIMQYYKSLEGKIMTFPLEIPCEQHRFILGKKGAGLKEIFDKTNVVVRIPTQEENLSVIQVMGETEKIGEAITMIYKMANAVTVVQIPAARWMQNQIRGDHNSRLDGWRTAHPDVRVNFREDHIALEGPPEEVKQIRSAIQEVIDDLNKRNITCIEVDIDPQYFKQLIGKSQSRLNEIQDQTSCEIRFPYDEGRIVQIMGTKANAEKARQLLVERAQKLSSEHTIELSIEPKHYPQLIGTKGKNLEEIRGKYNNIQITFPETNSKSDKVILHGKKEDVEQCSKYLQQKFKDLHSVEIAVPKRLYPMLIGKSGANIQRLREKVPEVRIDMPSIDDTKDPTPLRLNGKKADVEKARKLLEEHIAQLNTSMENSVEQTISIDPKWHSRFFLNKRKLLTDLQQQYGDMLIKIPERTSNSDQVVLRGPKETLDQVRKRLEELIDTWENTTTKEMSIPHRHHGYLLAHGGAQIQPIQKDHNVQIKFPPRPSNSKDEQQQQQQQESNVDEHQQDTVRITGRSDDIDRAIVALEKVIPIEVSFDIPFEGHGSLVGKGGANLQALNKQYPLVQITFPPMNSSQNTISLKGQRDQVEAVRKELQESYDKHQADRQARSFEVRFTIKPEYRSLILGARGKTINGLRQKYDVKIEVTHTTTPSTAIVPTPSATSNQEEETPTSDDQQAIPEENLVLPSETNPSNALTDIEVVITGYEEKALACRDDILQSIKEYEAKITMEIEIDPRIHARIIGSSGHKLKQIMDDYNVEIKFQANNKSDKVHVIGLDQEKIDACIDHLLVLEEDFLQDLPYRPSSSATQSTTEYPLGQSASHVQQQQQQQQEVPSTKPNNGKQQAPFQVKNAPWTNGNGNENEHYQQQNKYSRQRNGHDNSPKKPAPMAPNRDDLGEYPSFSNGAHSNTDDVGLQVQQTTVNSLPVIWGPQKRNK